MWLPGAAVTIAVTNTAQQLTTSLGLVKAIRFSQYWNNVANIYWGDSTLAPATPTGVIGWLPIPVTGNAPPTEEMLEPMSLNGVNAAAIWVAGTAGDKVLWSYCIQ